MEIDKILLDEIRENRREIKEIRKELGIFKLKAFSFMAVVSFVMNISIKYFMKQ
jgi:hypothetical protein